MAVIVAIGLPYAMFWLPLPPSLAESVVLGRVAPWGLALGGVAGLLSMAVIKHHDTSILIEQSACFLIGCGALIYIAALFQANDLYQALFAMGFTALVLLVCCWRFVQIQRYVKLRKEILGSMR